MRVTQRLPHRSPFPQTESVMQEYRTSAFIVRYDPAICTHAANCVRGLPAVFDVNQKPWVNVNGAPAEAIRRQVAACPSGALSFALVTPGSDVRGES